MSFEPIVERRTPVPVPPEAVFAWHARPGALDRLTPPWMKLEVPEPAPVVAGGRARLVLHAGPLRVHWLAEYQEVVPGRGFSDIQIGGPFERWRHEHRFEPAQDGGTILHDRIDFALPAGLRAAQGCVTRELERVLSYRHAVTAADLAMHSTAGSRRLRIAMSGATGFIGSLLIPGLTTGGHEVIRLVRRSPHDGEIRWDPVGAGLDPEALRGIDAVIHLAGENIAGRWTRRRKRAVRASRRTGTRLLAEAVARAREGEGPRILVSASAIGYYGERGEEVLTERSEPGRGFLPEVAQEWEAATGPAETAGVRVVRLRIGLPLSPAGGMLQRMLRPFRLGLGGRLGSGRQWLSWISADDLLGAFHHVLVRDALQGPINAVAPSPVRNAEFARELGRALRRPARIPVPAIALRALFGQMADEAILASTRVEPAVLQASGYRFRHPTLGAALAHVLGKPARA